MDLVLRSLGLVAEVEVNDQARELVEREAALFLRAGGRLTLAEWFALDPTTRAAFASAGDRLDGRLVIQPDADQTLLRTLSAHAERLENRAWRVA